MSKVKLGKIVILRTAGEQRAAIVTKVNLEDDTVNLHVFPNGPLDTQVGPQIRVKEGEEEGQYSMDETTPPVPPPPPKGKKAKEEEGE